jgi:hypothetical protein
MGLRAVLRDETRQLIGGENQVTFECDAKRRIEEAEAPPRMRVLRIEGIEQHDLGAISKRSQRVFDGFARSAVGCDEEAADSRPCT